MELEPFYNSANFTLKDKLLKKKGSTQSNALERSLKQPMAISPLSIVSSHLLMNLPSPCLVGLPF